MILRLNIKMNYESYSFVSKARLMRGREPSRPHCPRINSKSTSDSIVGAASDRVRTMADPAAPAVCLANRLRISGEAYEHSTRYVLAGRRFQLIIHPGVSGEAVFPPPQAQRDRLRRIAPFADCTGPPLKAAAVSAAAP